MMNMKNKTLAVLVAAGVLGISGAAFAGVNVSIKTDGEVKVALTHQEKKVPPKVAQVPDKRLPEAQKDKRPQLPPSVSKDRRMPPEMPPMSRDNRMPKPSEGRSPDKRPPEFRK